MNMIINGEIFIKLDVEEGMVYETKKGITPFLKMPNGQAFLLTNDNLFSLTKEVKERFYQMGLLSKVKKIDYLQNRGFYTFFSDGVYFYQVNALMNVVKRYSSKEEMDKHFIRLSDFLESATYVGKIFESSKGRTELLYQFGGVYLLRLNDGFASFQTTDPMLADYHIVDEETDSYDKDELYQVICKQEIEFGKSEFER